MVFCGNEAQSQRYYWKNQRWNVRNRTILITSLMEYFCESGEWTKLTRFNYSLPMFSWLMLPHTHTHTHPNQLIMFVQNLPISSFNIVKPVELHIFIFVVAWCLRVVYTHKRIDSSYFSGKTAWIPIYINRSILGRNWLNMQWISEWTQARWPFFWGMPSVLFMLLFVNDGIWALLCLQCSSVHNVRWHVNLFHVTAHNSWDRWSLPNRKN